MTLVGLVVVVAAWASSSTAVAREAASTGRPGASGGAAAGHRRPVRLGLELRRDPVPADADGRAHRRRAGSCPLLANVHARPLHGRPLVRGPRLDLADRRRHRARSPAAQLVPRGRARRENWIEQEVEVRALVDDHLAAAGTPTVLDSRRLGTVFLLSDGVLRVRDALSRGLRYRGLELRARSRADRPRAFAPAIPRRGRGVPRVRRPRVPAFRRPAGEAAASAIFDDVSYTNLAAYRPLYAAAQRVAGDARTPYEAVLALEGVVQAGRAVHLRRAAPPRRGATRSSIRDPHEGRLLPALRRGDGGDAADARDPGTRRRRLHERHPEGRPLGRDGPRRARLGRGLVRRAGLGAVRPHSRPRDLRRELLVRLRLGRRGRRSPARDARPRRLGDDDVGRHRPTSSPPRPRRTDVDRRSRARSSLSGRSGSSSSEAARHSSGEPGTWARPSTLGGGEQARARVVPPRPAHRRSTERDARRAAEDGRGGARPRRPRVRERRCTRQVGLAGERAPPCAGARQELRVLLRRMRLELSLWARFRGLVSLRSLQRGALR